MRLYEHEGKQLFRKFEIPVPKGYLSTNPDRGVERANQIGFPVMLKAQILTGGRGKAGGIIKADEKREVKNAMEKLLGTTLKSCPIRSVLIEERLRVDRELYLGVTIDRSVKRPVIMVSAEGGIDVERIAEEKILQAHWDPTKGIRQYEASKIAKKIGLKSKQMVQFTSILLSLVELTIECDAQTAEINPLVIDQAGNLYAADAKVVIDDDSLFLHDDWDFSFEDHISDPLEKSARLQDLSYVKLEGNIGIIAGGAGLALTTVDLIKEFGGQPANFLDTGGGVSPEKMANALAVVLTSSDIQGVLINVYGGINDCKSMSQGIVKALDNLTSSQRPPIVVKMMGHNEKKGADILEKHGITVVKEHDTERAVQILIEEMESEVNNIE